MTQSKTSSTSAFVPHHILNTSTCRPKRLLRLIEEGQCTGECLWQRSKLSCTPAVQVSVQVRSAMQTRCHYLNGREHRQQYLHRNVGDLSGRWSSQAERLQRRILRDRARIHGRPTGQTRHCRLSKWQRMLRTFRWPILSVFARRLSWTLFWWGRLGSDGQFSSSCCMIHKPHLSDWCEDACVRLVNERHCVDGIHCHRQRVTLGCSSSPRQ